jgi:DNA-binding Xre family transcriptional regulator
MTDTKKKVAKSLNELKFNSTLEKTLKELDITRNALAVEAKVRPATINAIVDGSVKSITLETLEMIIDALNRISFKKGKVRKFGIEDVFTYGK